MKDIVVKVIGKMEFIAEFPDVNLGDLPFQQTKVVLIHAPELMPEYPIVHPDVAHMRYQLDSLKLKAAALEGELKYAGPRRFPFSKIHNLRTALDDLNADIERLERNDPIPLDELKRHTRCLQAWGWFQENAEEVKIGEMPDWEDF